ncbi:ArsR family transcriptional regulator [Candidatus Bathyarchaeota archaeon]|nr:MAG: ArsR family transcriptional regulator [Candidatus Bathyarchaeota archaeon]
MEGFTVGMDKEGFVDGLIQSLKNPTRASIFYLLARRSESTATEISKDLGVDVDVVYYHLKLLRRAGLVSEPRVVVKRNFVEKFYSIHPNLKEKLLRSMRELAEKEKELSTEEFRKIAIALLSVVQSILAASIRRLKRVSSEVIDKIREEESLESKIILCSKERYEQLLNKLRKVARGDVLDTFDPIAKDYVIAIVAIPKLSEETRRKRTKNV